MDELKEEYQELSEQDLERYRTVVDTTRAERQQTGIRDRPKAMVKHVNNTFDKMEHEVRMSARFVFYVILTTIQWTSIMFRTGMEGFYVAVRGTTDEYHAPQMYFSEQAKLFFKDFMGVDSHFLALQFEAWTTTGLSKSAFL